MFMELQSKAASELQVLYSQLHSQVTVVSIAFIRFQACNSSVSITSELGINGVIRSIDSGVDQNFLKLRN